MKVFITSRSYQYEGETRIGVYDSVSKAKEAAQTDADRDYPGVERLSWSPSPTKWGVGSFSAPFQHFTYVIEEEEVQ